MPRARKSSATAIIAASSDVSGVPTAPSRSWIWRIRAARSVPDSSTIAPASSTWVRYPEGSRSSVPAAIDADFLWPPETMGVSIGSIDGQLRRPGEQRGMPEGRDGAPGRLGQIVGQAGRRLLAVVRDQGDQLPAGARSQRFGLRFRIGPVASRQVLRPELSTLADASRSHRRPIRTGCLGAAVADPTPGSFAG